LAGNWKGPEPSGDAREKNHCFCRVLQAVYKFGKDNATWIPTEQKKIV
jgi:hypothetical protein